METQEFEQVGEGIEPEGPSYGLWFALRMLPPYLFFVILQEVALQVFLQTGFFPVMILSLALGTAIVFVVYQKAVFGPLSAVVAAVEAAEPIELRPRTMWNTLGTFSEAYSRLLASKRFLDLQQVTQEAAGPKTEFDYSLKGMIIRAYIIFICVFALLGSSLLLQGPVIDEGAPWLRYR